VFAAKVPPSILEAELWEYSMGVKLFGVEDFKKVAFAMGESFNFPIMGRSI